MHPAHTCAGDAALLALIPAGTVVTGSRAATRYGTQVAEDYARELTDAGQPVITGIAYGIEAAAVRGVLAAGGRPIVVLAAGLERPYPLGNAQLLSAALQAGGVALSLADGAPTRDKFLARAEWLGAHSARTLIVEAAARSNALQVAAAATAAGKALGAVPGPVTSSTSTGTHQLLEHGAQLIHDVASLLAFARSTAV